MSQIEIESSRVGDPSRTRHPETGGAFDRTWFEEQYREFAGLVLAFLRSRVSTATADDLSQQVWMKVWTQAANQFDGRNFRAWVFQIARNSIVDAFRGRRRLQSSEGLDAVAVASSEEESRDSHEERTIALKDCLQQISEEFQAVIQARMTGEPYEAISERLDIPLGTAHSRFNKAKTQLQRCVEGKLT